MGPRGLWLCRTPATPGPRARLRGRLVGQTEQHRGIADDVGSSLRHQLRLRNSLELEASTSSSSASVSSSSSGGTGNSSTNGGAAAAYKQGQPQAVASATAAAATAESDAATAAASGATGAPASAVPPTGDAAACGELDPGSGGSAQEGAVDAVPPATALAAAAAPAKRAGTFLNRVIFGTLLGLGGAAVVAVGSVPYLLAALFVSYQSTQEFYGFVTARAQRQGVHPPSPLAAATTTALCLSITIATYASIGRTGTVLCVAVFLLLVLHVVGSNRPTFSLLTSSVFGLFYCGYLPSFWVKLRNVSAPGPELAWTVLPGWMPPLTVGLVATLTAVACIIAADTGAYFVGKNLGRTKLTDISPKKTVEGAAGGMASAVAVALLMWRLFAWPGSAAAAAGYGVLTFFSSLFGDLIESVMKRDAGLKDSGDLIPGHGGLLDRFDSYMFTGAMSYFYITFLLPKLGVL